MFAYQSNMTIIGNLTKDPEVNLTESGIAVCKFTVAVNHKKKGEDGQYEDDAEFFDCIAWRKQAELLGQYFTKGKPIVVEGQMRSNAWTDQEGNRRKTWRLKAERVTFIGKREDAGTNGPTETSAPATEPLQPGEDPFADN